MHTRSRSRGAGGQVPPTANLIVEAPKWLLPREKVEVVAKTNLTWRQVLRCLKLKAAPNGPNGVKVVSVHGYHPSFILKTERHFALHEKVGDLIIAMENGSTAKIKLSKKTKYTVRICVKNRSKGEENNNRLAAAAVSSSDSEAVDAEKEITPSDSDAQLAMETGSEIAFLGGSEDPPSDNSMSPRQELQSCSSDDRDTENVTSLPPLFPVIDLSSDSEEEDANEQTYSPSRSPTVLTSTSDSGYLDHNVVPTNFSSDTQSGESDESAHRQGLEKQGNPPKNDVDLMDVEEIDWSGFSNYAYSPAASICTTASEEEFELRSAGIAVENMEDLTQERLRSFTNAHKLKVKNELLKLKNGNLARWNRFFAYAPLAVNLLETVFKI